MRIYVVTVILFMNLVLDCSSAYRVWFTLEEEWSRITCDNFLERLKQF